LQITGIGTAVPPRVAPQDEAAALSPRFAGVEGREARMLRVLYRRSGVHTRHSVAVRGDHGPLLERVPYFPLPTGPDDRGPSTAARMAWYEQEAPALAEAAVRGALVDAGVEPGAVSHLVTVSCTGFFSPGVEGHLIEAVGLPAGVERTHVGFMGCHGALNGLRAADALAAAHPEAVVLLCAVELCTLHFAYGWDQEMLVANTLFADGAAAVVGRGAGAGARGSEGSAGPWRVAATGSVVLPDSRAAMSWRIGDHGFRMTLSPAVPELIRTHLAPWMDGWLGAHGLSVAEVGSWAVHPGGPRIVDAVEEALALGRGALDPSRELLATHGNMSSPTVLFLLERLRREDAPRPCVALAFGPGLAAEATLLV
ncbi:MAG: type III polyketide synthase, partial [Longimicrobiales bacterium]|nr:type III polyketide synthase [Longimicrobiales bacterium]